MLTKNPKLLLRSFLDICAVVISFYAAMLLRFNFNIPEKYTTQIMVLGIGTLVFVRTLTFYFTGLFRSASRYVSINEAILIIRSVLYSSLISIIILLVTKLWFPRLVLIMDAIFLIIIISLIHFSGRIFYSYIRTISPRGKRVLIYGAGDAGDMVIREILRSKKYDYNIRGFIDDDPSKKGMIINGVPVKGGRDKIKEIVEHEYIEEVLIAIPSASGKIMREILDMCNKVGVTTSTVPNLFEILQGKISVGRIRSVNLEDLIRRQPVEFDIPLVNEFLKTKKVLITGAAGSIGSELSKQVLNADPNELYLIDKEENGLFNLKFNLENIDNGRVKYFILNLSDFQKAERLVRELKPDIIFHSAAYKHVPVLEENVDEAITNNLRNTISLAKTADKAGVEKFIFISTDKAVNPLNTMGASKRLAELYLKNFNKNTKTKFITVRFGNVIGSSGSVVPIFKKQIETGRPITITHKDVERYFMTIPEAVSLINQASMLGSGGEIFILDMGNPIKILDLAKDIIRLSGLKPYEDIDIIFTGLRPGEKLNEELWFEDEAPEYTENPKILRAKASDNGMNNIEKISKELIKLSENGDVKKVREILASIFPDFGKNI
ncbi:polysaccharide biosynthesis protein [candidate division KSB1 bacterium]